MQTKSRIVKAARLTAACIVLITLLFTSGSGSFLPTVAAQQPGPETPPAENEWFQSETVTTADGTELDVYTINGPSEPPAGFEAERQAVDEVEVSQSMAAKTLSVPALDWYYGCSATSGAMIAGYYDRNGYPNMYTGPMNGGLFPMPTSAMWGSFTDGAGATYPMCPLIASRNGLDGRTTRGSIDDYWVSYGSSASDPYISGGWSQHSYSTAIGDYMKTSQSAYNNTDGSTRFYNWTSSATPLTCQDMVDNGITDDGTLGRRAFYQARGYTVTDCFNQKTDNNGGGFTYAMYKAQIDANRPVMINLAGHTVVGVGYNDTGSLVYIHDTWDYNTYSFTWGGSYEGMQLLSVSIVNLTGGTPPPTGDKKLYMPMLGKPGPAFTGKVFDNTTMLGGQVLTMRYSEDGGSTWSTYGTTTTLANGTFTFTDTPVLDNSSKRFYVYWGNNSTNANRLFRFECNLVTSANRDYTCNINVRNMPLTSPANNAHASNPVPFKWTMRATTTDNYSWHFYNYSTGSQIGSFINLGYRNNINITFTGFNPATPFLWSIHVTTPDGFGMNYTARVIYFRGSGSPALSGTDVFELTPSEEPGQSLFQEGEFFEDRDIEPAE